MPKLVRNPGGVTGTITKIKEPPPDSDPDSLLPTEIPDPEPAEDQSALDRAADVLAANQRTAPAKPKRRAATAQRSGVAGVVPAPQAFESLEEQATIVNGMWCGDYKTGKTTALATMANLGPIVFINAESGIKKQPLIKHGVNVANVLLWPNRATGEPITFDTLEGLYWKMAADIAGAAERGDPPPYAGVVWDSITDITDTLLKNITEAQAGRAMKSGEIRDRFFTDRADYGTMGDQVKLLLKRFRDLPIHFGCSALLRRDVDDDGRVIYRPAVIPSLANAIGGYVDVICVTDVYDVGDGGDDVYRGLFRPAGKFRGGDRFGVLPKRLPDPTFERVLAYVGGQLDVDSDPRLAEVQVRVAASTAAEATARAARGGADAPDPDDPAAD